MTKLETIKKYGVSAQGRKELMSYLKGKDLTLQQAVLARCYDCMSYFADGAADCKIPECPLYPYMPFRTIRPCKKTVKKGGVKSRGKRGTEEARKKEMSKTAKEKRARTGGRKTEKKAEPPKKGSVTVVRERTAPQKAEASPRKRKTPPASPTLF
ncbi:MAG: hypothetical protein U0411_11995 [Thermodesulfovibrionales bacterium]